jgi:hypothetical protein
MASAVVVVASNSPSSSTSPTVASISGDSTGSRKVADSSSFGMNGRPHQSSKQHESFGALATSASRKQPAATGIKDTDHHFSRVDELTSRPEGNTIGGHRQGSCERSVSAGNGPLPRKLKQILLEVAKTGGCAWLAWEQEHDPSSTTTAGLASAHPTDSSNVKNTLHPTSAAAAAAAKPSSWEYAKASFSTTRRATGQGSLRRKYSNGIHCKAGSNAYSSSSRMRFGNLDGASSSSRKRPLFSARTAGGHIIHPSNAATSSSTAAGPGSVYSSAPSSVGSEPDDSTQYECDSEGTSATTNSEVSVERRRRAYPQLTPAHLSGPPAYAKTTETFFTSGEDGSPYKTLQGAFRSALGLVLDHFYHSHGGYKLSPAENRRNVHLEGGSDKPTAKVMKGSVHDSDDNNKLTPLSSEDVFLQRRQRLMMMLLPSSAHPEYRPFRSDLAFNTVDPPFTIQRLAEVLIAPDRVCRKPRDFDLGRLSVVVAISSVTFSFSFQYYTQTHKLCNCLEKLLLVTSSTEAFGGSTGGSTSQSRTEERELAALADEKGKQEFILRRRRFRRKTSSPSDDMFAEERNVAATTAFHKSSDNATANTDDSACSKCLGENKGLDVSSPSKKNRVDANADESSRELLEAAARASLRTKFDHVGIDPHHSSPERDLRAIVEERRMNSSPPPPSLSMSAAVPNIGLPGHTVVGGFHRGSSPVLFSGSDPSHLTAASNMHMLQLHHVVSMAGASLNRGNLDLTTIDTGPISPTRGQAFAISTAAEHADLEGDQGRSSASNSDVDSESDDISFDDSASDRSDSSDSGTHAEPFTAARAMALNRMQQQQRLQSRNFASLSSLQYSDGYRPLVDSDYQSGDSIDSTRAEDSGGSDSSSSDMAD